MTLSTQQFAALLHAVAGDGAQDRKRTAQHERTATRTHAQDKARAHAHAGGDASRRTARTELPQSRQRSGETQHGTTQHTTAQTHTQTHDGETHDSGTHDGGCD